MATADRVVIGTDPAKTVLGLVDTLAGSRLASIAAILILALVCFLPGFNTLPPLDSDEPRFAEATREMMVSGNYATVRLQSAPATITPIGIYWLQAAAAGLSGKGAAAPIWVYRLPSLLGGIAASLLTWWAALAFGRPRAALMAGFLVAASAVLVMEVRFARTDAALLAAIVLAEGALARLWRRPDDRPDYGQAFLFWTGIGLGVLLKGWVAPVVILFTLAVLALERRSLQWLWRLAPRPGLAWALILTSPWLIAALISLSHGSAVTAPADASAIESTEAPPGTYTLLFAAIFGPGTSFFLLAVPWLIDHVRRPAVLFCLAWAVPFWLAAELMPVKLPHFVLPAFPAIAILTATAIEEGAVAIRGRLSWLLSVGPLVWPPAFAIAVPIGFILVEGRIPYVALLPLAASAVTGPIAWLWLRRGEAGAAAALSVVSAVFLYLAVFGAVLPDLSTIHMSGRLIAAGHAAVKCPNPRFVAAGFPEQSLVFLSGGEAGLVSAASAASFLNGDGCRVAFVESRQVSSFRQGAEDVGLEVLDRGKVTGVELGRARAVDLRIYTVKGPAE
jgi:4-amino-4-deoxy-L-arabinose transferase-like glycosyltransferase